MFLLAFLLAASDGCSSRKALRVRVPVIGTTQTGVASWYGDPYHGRRTASGEVYDMDQWTAAHPTFAFDTWVLVENLDNGKSVQARINDRGPFVRGRIIDLSRAAARSIDMLGPGTAKVRLRVIPPPNVAASGSRWFSVQVGAFRNRDNAERVKLQLADRFPDIRLVSDSGRDSQFRVLVGRYEGHDLASQVAGELKRDHRGAFVVPAPPD